MQIRIDYLVKVDFQGFVNIIDILGGVEINIEKAMRYDDHWGKLHINFKKGPALLNGKKALEYCRFRADAAADLGRIKRQQKFLAALIHKLLQPSTVMRLPSIVREAIRCVETDLSLSRAMELALLLKSGGAPRIKTMSLPGEARYVDKISYFLPYKDQAVKLGGQFFADLTILEMDATFTADLATGTP